MRSKSINLTRGAVSLVCVWILIVLAVFGAGPLVYFLSQSQGELPGLVKECGHVLRGEYTELEVYKENAASLFEELYIEAASQAASTQAETGTARFFDTFEDRDVVYRAVYTRENGRAFVLTNAEEWNGEDQPEGFNYLFIYRGGEVLIRDGPLNEIYDSAEPFAPYYSLRLTHILESRRNDADAMRTEVHFAVRRRATVIPGAAVPPSLVIGETEEVVRASMFRLSVAALVALLILLILIFAVAFRRDRKALVRKIGELWGCVWFEVKLLLFAAAVPILAMLAVRGYEGALTALCLALMLAHLAVTDLRVNRRIWRQSLVFSLMRAVRRRGHGFSSRLGRTYVCLVAALGCTAAVGALVFLFLAANRVHSFLLVAAAVMTVLTLCALLAAFGLFLREDLRELDELFRQIEGLYKGDLNAVNRIPMQSPLHGPATQLNMIRDGIRFAVEQSAQSERTKIELITNVSHDIKTPLTAIISYIDLLQNEEDLPETAREYVRVLGQKADRLGHMVQDIFDISKAATGNLPLHMERISLDKLLRQTLAEMDAVLREGKLVWRVQIPEVECVILADGQKLYRVFQNLIKNASQYALAGSRVYLSLFQREEEGTVQIQNVTEREMELDAEQMTARFVRGDGSREGTGSGLGLSIAKSFTESMGGKFRVYVHGDVFTAEVTFPLAAEPEEKGQEIGEFDKSRQSV